MQRPNCPIQSGIPFQLTDPSTQTTYETNGEYLGKGATAIVYKGWNAKTKEPVAIKELYIGGNKSVKEKELMKTEISIMQTISRVKHDNVVGFYYAERRQYDAFAYYQYIVVEFCNGDDLDGHMKRNPAYSEHDAKLLMRQFAAGLLFLRENNICHRDLKPGNILLHYPNGDKTQTPILKIADYGFARSLEGGQLAETCVGTPLFMAPEVRSKNYSSKADLWSVGLILYWMLYKDFPFSKTPQTMTELVRIVNTFTIVPFRSSVSAELKDLLNGLLKREPSQRIEWKAFFTHPWFEKPIVLPHFIEPANPRIKSQIDLLTPVADLAEELSRGDKPGCALNIYIQLFTEWKILYTDLKNDKSIVDIKQLKEQMEICLLQADSLAKFTETEQKNVSEIIFNEALVKGQEALKLKNQAEVSSDAETKLEALLSASEAVNKAIPYFEYLMSSQACPPFSEDKLVLKNMLTAYQQETDALQQQISVLCP